jgi:hypothetical protein
MISAVLGWIGYAVLFAVIVWAVFHLPEVWAAFLSLWRR